AGAALVPTCLLVFAPQFPKPFDDEFFKLGYAYHVQGRLPEAEQAYDRALAINPDNLSARKNRAVLLEQRSERQRAYNEWRDILERAQRLREPAYAKTAQKHLAALQGSYGNERL